MQTMLQLTQVKADGILSILKRIILGESEVLMSKISVLQRLGDS